MLYKKGIGPFGGTHLENAVDPRIVAVALHGEIEVADEVQGSELF